MKLVSLAVVAVTLGPRAAHADCTSLGLPAPGLSARDAAAFPSAIGPALTGPFAGLAWGMPADRVATIARPRWPRWPRGRRRPRRATPSTSSSGPAP